MNSSAQVAGRAIKCFSVLCTSQSEECFALLDSCFFCLHSVFKVKFLISLFPLKFFLNFLSLHTHFQYIVIIVISVSLSQTLLLLLTPFSPTSLLYTLCIYSSFVCRSYSHSHSFCIFITAMEIFFWKQVTLCSYCWAQVMYSVLRLAI